MPACRAVAVVLIAIGVARCSANSGAASVRAGLDDGDRQQIHAAELQALEAGPSGAPVAWRNPDSGRYGNVVPGPAYQANGASCRPYTDTAYIDGRPQTARRTACRNPDGTWTTLN